MNPNQAIAHFRRQAEWYRKRTEELKRTAPIQSVAQCPCCTAGTRGGAMCPECLEAIADRLELTIKAYEAIGKAKP
jgi:hypothetical protein